MADMQALEERTMLLLVDAGNAKSKAMEAIAAAKGGDFDKAEALLKECGEAMTKAHQSQSEFIQDSLEDSSMPVSLLMTHAEDHMMGAIIASEMAREIVDLHKLLHEQKKEG